MREDDTSWTVEQGQGGLVAARSPISLFDL